MLIGAVLAMTTASSLLDPFGDTPLQRSALLLGAGTQLDDVGGGLGAGAVRGDRVRALMPLIHAVGCLYCGHQRGERKVCAA